MSPSTPKEQARSCLVKLYTQAFYHGVANGGPRSVANYRIARAKVDDTFGSLAATALERYLEDCPHHADSVKVDIVLDDQYFRLHPCDSLGLLEKGEVTHVILSLPPRLPRSARATSVSRAASVTRAASTRATTPPSKNQRRRSSTVQPASAPTKIQPVLISDSDRDSDDISAAPVLKRATAKTRPSSVIGPQTSKGRAQIPKDAEVLSISSDVSCRRRKTSLRHQLLTHYLRLMKTRTTRPLRNPKLGVTLPSSVIPGGKMGRSFRPSSSVRHLRRCSRVGQPSWQGRKTRRRKSFRKLGRNPGL